MSCSSCLSPYLPSWPFGGASGKKFLHVRYRVEMHMIDKQFDGIWKWKTKWSVLKKILEHINGRKHVHLALSCLVWDTVVISKPSQQKKIKFYANLELAETAETKLDTLVGPPSSIACVNDRSRSEVLASEGKHVAKLQRSKDISASKLKSIQCALPFESIEANRRGEQHCGRFPVLNEYKNDLI